MAWIIKLFGGWQGYLIAGAAVLVIGFGSGWKTRDAFCDAAEAKAEVVALRKQIDARDAAAAGDAIRAAADAQARIQLEGAIRELQDKISDGVCFAPADADRLRSIFK